MKLIKLLILLSGLSIVLSSCGSLGQASKVLRNEKVSTTDEFLIKKRGPLTQPPDFRKIPEPESLEKKKQTRIKIILKKFLKKERLILVAIRLNLPQLKILSLNKFKSEQKYLLKKQYRLKLF